LMMFIMMNPVRDSYFCLFYSVHIHLIYGYYQLMFLPYKMTVIHINSYDNSENLYAMI